MINNEREREEPVLRRTPLRKESNELEDVDDELTSCELKHLRYDIDVKKNPLKLNKGTSEYSS